MLVYVFMKSSHACRVQVLLPSLSLSRGVKERLFYKHPLFQIAVTEESSIIGLLLPAPTHTPALLRPILAMSSDRKSSMLTEGFQLVRLPHHSDDRRTETCFAEPKCPAPVPLVKNKHVPLEK